MDLGHGDGEGLGELFGGIVAATFPVAKEGHQAGMAAGEALAELGARLLGEMLVEKVHGGVEEIGRPRRRLAPRRDHRQGLLERAEEIVEGLDDPLALRRVQGGAGAADEQAAAARALLGGTAVAVGKSLKTAAVPA
jgi:hypothetical protein